MKRAIAIGSGACVIALVASGCGSQGIYSIPLPGGAKIGDNPMHLTVQFDDVLDLVPQSTVKVDGVPVGRVENVGVPSDGWTANVDVVVDSSVNLPANALASVQQTSLLGEKFIELKAPAANPDAARLSDGATIPVDRTRHATDIEQVLGALSLLLNGGGVAQLQPIIHELTNVFDGREQKVRGLLDQANTLVDGLNQQRDDITRALDGLDALSGRVVEQTGQIDKILAEIPPAVQVLNEQRPQFVQMLGQLDRLGQVGTDVLTKSKDNLIADLRALRPTLQALADSGDDLVTVLPLIPTFPFPDGAEKVIHGNSMNLFLSLDMRIGQQLDALGVGQPDPVYIAPPPGYGGHVPKVDPSNPYYNGNGPRPGWPTVSLLPLPPIVPAPAPPPGAPVAPGTEPAKGKTDEAKKDEAPQNPLSGLLDKLGVGGR
ncbi:MCE family protein [Rhodococcus spelaei]|uniref:MCE family protein n=1 Tax=Rhodococcus spelaei TaxID=2546320 RepID=A0A541B8Q6_9NOCA|nr:MCE family protein [Rhodococcus spelaei]TQF68704.1 MCE family protein [Rhodococcus spelaei]